MTPAMPDQNATVLSLCHLVQDTMTETQQEAARAGAVSRRQRAVPTFVGSAF